MRSKRNSPAISPAVSLMLVAATSVYSSVASAQVEPMPAELRVAPLPGRRTATVTAPTFCAGATVAPLRSNQLRVNYLRTVMNLYRASTREQAPGFTVPTGFIAVAKISCAHGSDPAMRDWIQAWRQVIVNTTDLDDPTIDQILHGALAQTGRGYTVECGSFAPNVPTGLHHERLRADLLRSLVCDSAPLLPVDELVYWFDRGPAERDPLPQLVRGGLILAGLRLQMTLLRGWDEREVTVRIQGGELLKWIAVRDDVASLDLNAARRELTQTGLPPDAQAWAMMNLSRIKMFSRAVGAAWHAEAGRNAAIAPLLDAVPDAARDAWRQETAANAEGVQRAWAVEQSVLEHNRTGFEGCVAPLRNAFAQYAARAGVRTQQDVEALFSRPVGHLLGAALYRCEREVGTAAHSTVFARLIVNATLQRGARLASIQAVVRAVAQAQEADPRFVLIAREMNVGNAVQFEDDWLTGANMQSSTECRGTVGSLRREGDRVHVTYRQEQVRVPTFNCTRSNRISRINRDGTVEYEQLCVVVGHVMEDATSPPVAIPAELASAVQVGTFLRATRGTNEVLGYPTEVRPTPAGALISYIGISLADSPSSATLATAPRADAGRSPAARRR